MQALSSIFIQ